MSSEKRACRDDSKSGGLNHAGKKLRLEQEVAMKTADQQMGAGGGDEGARKEAMADVHMEENVCEGQDPIEAGAGLACGKQEVGFIVGADLAFKDAHGGPINQDDPTSVPVQNASMVEACLVGGDNVYTTPLHMRKTTKGASVGPRCFTSSREMLKFFNQLLNGWPLNYDINKYEHMMLEDLLKKGHPNFAEKIGTGIRAFQVRIKKPFDDRCFYVITKDGPINDFSYRKCVDRILSLPKNLKSKFGKAQQDNGNTRFHGAISQHSSRGTEKKPNGNGQHDSGGHGHKIQGRGNSSRHK